MYLKSALKCNSLDVIIGIKIPFLSFGYYWAGLLLTTVRYHELFDMDFAPNVMIAWFMLQNLSAMEWGLTEEWYIDNDIIIGKKNSTIQIK